MQLVAHQPRGDTALLKTVSMRRAPTAEELDCAANGFINHIFDF